MDELENAVDMMMGTADDAQEITGRYVLEFCHAEVRQHPVQRHADLNGQLVDLGLLRLVDALAAVLAPHGRSVTGQAGPLRLRRVVHRIVGRIR